MITSSQELPGLPGGGLAAPATATTQVWGSSLSPVAETDQLRLNQSRSVTSRTFSPTLDYIAPTTLNPEPKCLIFVDTYRIGLGQRVAISVAAGLVEATLEHSTRLVRGAPWPTATSR